MNPDLTEYQLELLHAVKAERLMCEAQMNLILECRIRFIDINRLNSISRMKKAATLVEEAKKHRREPGKYKVYMDQARSLFKNVHSDISKVSGGNYSTVFNEKTDESGMYKIRRECEEKKITLYRLHEATIEANRDHACFTSPRVRAAIMHMETCDPEHGMAKPLTVQTCEQMTLKYQEWLEAMCKLEEAIRPYTEVHNCSFTQRIWKKVFG